MLILQREGLDLTLNLSFRNSLVIFDIGKVFLGQSYHAYLLSPLTERIYMYQ